MSKLRVSNHYYSNISTGGIRCWYWDILQYHITLQLLATRGRPWPRPRWRPSPAPAALLRPGTVQYSAVQYSTAALLRPGTVRVQYSAVQYSTVQCSTVQYSAVQRTSSGQVTTKLYLKLNINDKTQL